MFGHSQSLCPNLSQFGLVLTNVNAYGIPAVTTCDSHRCTRPGEGIEHPAARWAETLYEELGQPLGKRRFIEVGIFPAEVPVAYRAGYDIARVADVRVYI
jgi:hypothetical protein